MDTECERLLLDFNNWAISGKWYRLRTSNVGFPIRSNTYITPHGTIVIVYIGKDGGLCAENI